MRTTLSFGPRRSSAIISAIVSLPANAFPETPRIFMLWIGAPARPVIFRQFHLGHAVEFTFRRHELNVDDLPTVRALLRTHRAHARRLVLPAHRSPRRASTTSRPFRFARA